MVVSIQFSQLRKSMKKQFYIAIAAPVLALSLFTSCSKEEEDIFDDSAANRLSTAKTEIASRLTADGGKWAMEYFCNESEPGYLFVMTFKPSGAVEIAADHKWIGNTYRAETSLWEMIADSGPVLSFNSYNEVFHIFSSPEDITGPDAPTNPDRPDENGNPSDINETGYGHNGDYEFVVMEGDSDHDNIRLLSKKRGYNIYMHRLSADTDPQAYLTENKAVADNMFSKIVGSLCLTDGVTGERFVMSQMHTGVAEVYPESGDAVTQTVKANFITTKNGIRFMKPFSIPRADESADHYVVETFNVDANSMLVAADGSRITAPALSDFVLTSGNEWRLDVNSATGAYARIGKMAADVKAYRQTFSFSYASLKLDEDQNKMLLFLKINGQNSTDGRIYFDVERVDDNTMKFIFVDDDAHHDKAGGAYYKNVPAFKTLVDAFSGSSIAMTAPGVYVFDSITFMNPANSNDAFKFNVR